MDEANEDCLTFIQFLLLGQLVLRAHQQDHSTPSLCGNQGGHISSCSLQNRLKSFLEMRTLEAQRVKATELEVQLGFELRCPAAQVRHSLPSVSLPSSRT